jgi:hypothetical protein
MLIGFKAYLTTIFANMFTLVRFEKITLLLEIALFFPYAITSKIVCLLRRT